MKRTALRLELLTVGESVRGAPIFCLPPGDDCRLLVIAGIHGEEPETTVSLSRATRSLESVDPRIGLVFSANPDGILLGTRGNANGVDLNRNFPTEDWQAEPVTCRWHVDEEERLPILTGTSPGSEPETRVLIDLVETWRPATILALHGPLACIDDPLSSAPGKWLAGETGLPLVEDVGYPTPGSLGTWAGERGIPLVTWEFPGEGIERLSRSQVPVLVEILRGASPFTPV